MKCVESGPITELPHKRGNVAYSVQESIAHTLGEYNTHRRGDTGVCLRSCGKDAHVVRLDACKEHFGPPFMRKLNFFFRTVERPLTRRHSTV